MPVVTDLSSTFFVYPFRFPPSRFGELQQQLGAATVSWRERDVSVWEEAPLPVDDLLPQVVDLFRSEAGPARLWRLRREARAPFGATDEVQWALHLKGRQVPFRLGEDGPRSDGMSGGGVLLALFDSGVGLLALAASPRSDDLGTWLDFLHWFRFHQGGRARPVSARAFAGDESRDFSPVGTTLSATYPFAGVFSALLRTAGGAEPWWSEAGESGRLLPYSILFLDGERAESQPTLLYQVRNCFHRNLGRLPSDADRAPNHPSLLPHARRQWFASGLESAAFVAFDAPDDAFFRQRLPVDLGEVYFLVFLLALQQKLALGALGERIAADDVDDAEAFERLRQDVLSFTVRGNPVQVAHEEYPQRLYERLRAAFQVEPLFYEVDAELRARHDLVRTRQGRRAETLAEAQLAKLREQEEQRATQTALIETLRRDFEVQGQRLQEGLQTQVRTGGEGLDRMHAALQAFDARLSDLLEAVRTQGASLEAHLQSLQAHREETVEQAERHLDQAKQHAAQLAEQAKVQAEQHVAQMEKLGEQLAEQAGQHAEQMRKLGEQQAEQSTRHTEHVKKLGEQQAEQSTQHAEHMKKLAEQQAEQSTRHAEHMKKLAEQQAEHSAQHAEHVKSLGEQHAMRARQARSLERRISFVAVLIGVPALVTSFLGINVSGWTSKTDGITLGEAAGWTIGGLILGWAVLWILEKKAPKE